jgi:hypothetical protein
MDLYYIFSYCHIFVIICNGTNSFVQLTIFWLEGQDQAKDLVTDIHHLILYNLYIFLNSFLTWDYEGRLDLVQLVCYSDANMFFKFLQFVFPLLFHAVYIGLIFHVYLFLSQYHTFMYMYSHSM